MKKILHIFGKMDRAGAETRTMEVMRNIDRSSFIFEFVSCSGEKGDYDDEIEYLGGKVHKLKIYNISFIFRLYKLIKINRYDAIHSHIHYISGLIMLIAWLAGCKRRISHFRTTGNNKDNKKIKNKIMKVFVQLFSTKIIAVSEYTMSCVWGEQWNKKKKCSVIVNGIQSQYAPDFDSSKFRTEYNLGSSTIILHVGRIEEEKNHIFLLELFSYYLKRDPDAKLLLVGRCNTEEAEKVRKKILELNLSSSVILTGVRNDVYRFYNTADVMVFPSLWEGLPGAVLEALSAGLPVVASEIGSHIEIKKEIKGLQLVSLRDSLLKWSNEIEKTIKVTQREKLRKEFMDSRYYFDKYLKSFISLYESN